MTPLFQQLKDSLHRYREMFPKEADRLTQLGRQAVSDADQIFLRSNMSGHITASALVLNQARSHVLMIFHPTFQRWLPPGGHIELGCTSLWDAAMDELAQETGLTSAHPIPELGDSVPLDIDTHAIPVNAMKGEGPHFHHDLMFLAQAPNEFVPMPRKDDAVKVAKWLVVGEFVALGDARIRRMARKLIFLGDEVRVALPVKPQPPPTPPSTSNPPSR